MKVGIIGTGSWGTALAQVLADNNVHVLMYGINIEHVDSINNEHQLPIFFGDTKINPNVKATTDIQQLKDSDIILMAVPTAAVESVSKEINEILTKPTIIINVAKGFHPTTHQLLSEVIKENIDPENLIDVVSLIGPSHAEEVIKRNITVINSVCKNDDTNKIVQELFSNDYFRVYRNTDVVGAQIGVAIKNIISLASGALEGLNLGDNAKAALITRGLAEMTRYGLAKGGSLDTFLGLCGVGDLVVTCTSPHSRNFQAGLQVGRTRDGKKFMSENSKTVEGVFAAKAVWEEAHKEGIDMPITEQVYQVFYEGKDPEIAIKELMLRDLKAE